MKTKKYTSPILLLSFMIIGCLASGHSAFCQQNDCFEIKYLDHFGLQNADSLPLNIANWEKLLHFELIEKDTLTTNFLIPFIMSDIRRFHPACDNNTDTMAYRVLTQVYHKIRKMNYENFAKNTLVKQLEFLRNDFYKQVQSDSLLAHMKYTLDDGPFYGENVAPPDLKDNQVFSMPFGKLVISNAWKQSYISAFDGNERLLWSKKMIKKGNQSISGISFDKDAVKKTSLGYTIMMAADGKGLTLYLKDDGDFRFFFHSW